MLGYISGMAGLNVWYVRRGDEVKGPYPSGLITRYVLLGRVRANDEVSIDGATWGLISDHPDLIPSVMKDPDAAPQRLEAARRWADERDGERRSADGASETAAGEQRQRSERRAPEIPDIVDYRVSRSTRAAEHAESARQWLGLLGIVAVTVGVVAVILYFYKPPPPEQLVDCSAKPAPSVNWSDCVLTGVNLAGADLTGAKLYSANMTGANFRGAHLAGGNLSYSTLSLGNFENADLRGATLTGANLRGAQLSHAHFDKADLSYADLTGAELAGVELSDAKLGNTIWAGGMICAPESVGTCLPRS